MANLQIKGMSDDFYAQIKELAGSESRSVSQQVLFMTKEYLLKKQQVQAAKMPAQALLELSGAWEDSKTAEEIIGDLKKSRKNSARAREVF
jgi:hypothetical protein